MLIEMMGKLQPDTVANIRALGACVIARRPIDAQDAFVCIMRDLGKENVEKLFALTIDDAWVNIEAPPQGSNGVHAGAAPTGAASN